MDTISDLKDQLQQVKRDNKHLRTMLDGIDWYRMYMRQCDMIEKLAEANETLEGENDRLKENE